jgi:hypothetical protein
VSFLVLRDSVSKKGRLAGEKNEPVDEEGIEKVYCEIEDMIAGNTEAVYFVVERKGQKTNVPSFKPSILRGIQDIFCIFGFKEKRQVFDYRVFYNAMEVIKLKCCLESIRICNETNKENKKVMNG